MTTTVHDTTDSPAHKAYAARLRALAAWIEANPHLPVPTSIGVQASIFSTVDDQISTVERAADALGVQMRRWYDAGAGENVSCSYEHPDGWTYRVHANSKYASDYRLAETAEAVTA